MGLIAIYHLSIKIISRNKGRSAVAAAAYRAGEKITNVYDGVTHDYTHKPGVVHTEVLLPANAPKEHNTRSTLWNAIEQIEKSKNAQLAREIELALPVELSFEQNLELVRAYCQQHFVSAGMCADICIHDKGDGNPHAHIMLTMRPFNADKMWGAKQKKEYMLDRNGEKIYDAKKRQYKCKSVPSTDWNGKSKAEEWRQGWADLVNEHLGKSDSKERVDHRSYERQGVEQIPTIHIGVSASQMERRGIVTARGNHNREVVLNNGMLRQLRVRINKLQKQLAVLVEKRDAQEIPSPPINFIETLLITLQNSQEKGRYRKVADLKNVAKAVSFLQENGITDVRGLQEKITEIRQRFDTVSDKLKKTERRLKTLDAHIRNADAHFQYQHIYRDYQQQKPGKQAAFYERHHTEITLYESATKYLRKVLNGRRNIPLKKWKTEAISLAAEKKTMYQDYYLLKDEVRETDLIQKSVERAMQNELSGERDRNAERE